MIKKLFCAAVVLLMFTSCFALPVEEPVPPPPVLSSGSEVSYRTTEVLRSDVVLWRELSASYVAAREESPSFDIGDEYITAINADIGDTVEAGDVIAEIDTSQFLDELETLEFEEAWTRLDLSHLEESYALQLEEAETDGSFADESAYAASRSELESKLEAYELRREYLRNEIERRILRAGLSGIVTYALPFTEGTVSVADKAIATIADESESVFMVRGQETERMEVGNHYEMTIDWVQYDSVVIDPAQIGIARASDEETYLVITDEDQPAVTSRTYARVMLILDEAKDVLMIPSGAVKFANARTFVYMLDETGLRGIRDVELGLQGSTHTEIVRGLEEGESVILD